MQDIHAARQSFATDISLAKDPEEIFAALHRFSDATVGGRLFTVMTVDLEAGLARRAYSSHPQDYPTSGTKPITRDSWFEGVYDRNETFVANTLAEIATVFGDYELIGALGCGSVVNLPVRRAGALVATVNILDAEHYWTPERLDLLHRELPIPAIAAMALLDCLSA